MVYLSSHVVAGVRTVTTNWQVRCTPMLLNLLSKTILEKAVSESRLTAFLFEKNDGTSSKYKTRKNI